MAIPPGELESRYAKLGPVTGRQVLETGELFNVADAARLRQLSDIDVASRQGNLYRGFWQGTVPATSTREFVIDIPAGIDLFGFSRISGVGARTLFSTFLSCTGFVSAEGPIDGRSFDRRTGRKSVSQCKIHRASSLSGVIQHSPRTEIFIADTGAIRAPSSQTEAGALPAFDENELPAFRYENESGTAATLSLYLFWQELPVEPIS